MKGGGPSAAVSCRLMFDVNAHVSVVAVATGAMLCGLRRCFALQVQLELSCSASTVFSRHSGISGIWTVLRSSSSGLRPSQDAGGTARPQVCVRLRPEGRLER